MKFQLLYSEDRSAWDGSLYHKVSVEGDVILDADYSIDKNYIVDIVSRLNTVLETCDSLYELYSYVNDMKIIDLAYGRVLAIVTLTNLIDYIRSNHMMEWY